MELTAILVEIIGGAVGGNISGALNRPKSMGATANSLIGALGGIFAGQSLHFAGILDGAGMGSEVLGAAVGGLVWTLVVTFFKK